MKSETVTGWMILQPPTTRIQRLSFIIIRQQLMSGNVGENVSTIIIMTKLIIEADLQLMS